MASSSAACVLGGVRLISSARITLANSGPSRNLNSRWPVERFSSMISVPVMSDGIRSGVNWMRLNDSDRHFDSVLIISVLARPGTPSSMQWPRLNSAMSSSSMTSSWPTMTRASCFLRLSKASRSRRMASMSLCARSAAATSTVGMLSAPRGVCAWSLMQVSSVVGDGTRKRGKGRAGRPRGPQTSLALVDRQGRLVELEDRQVHGGDEHRADVAAAPAAVGPLAVLQAVEDRLLVLGPGEAVALLGFGEQLGPAVVAEHVHGLGVVVVRVLVVAEALGAAEAQRHVALAEEQPLLDQRRLVLAGGEAARDGRRGQGRPAVAAAAAAEAVDHAALGVGGVGQVLDRLVDDFFRHHDAGVAGGPDRLELGDRHRALVEVAAVGRRHVAPATAAGLGPAAELHRPRQDVLQLLAAVAVLLLAVDRRQEEQGEAVTVHVAAGLAGVVGVADQAVGLAADHQPIDGPADAVGVLALADGAAFHEE